MRKAKLWSYFAGIFKASAPEFMFSHQQTQGIYHWSGMCGEDERRLGLIAVHGCSELQKKKDIYHQTSEGGLVKSSEDHQKKKNHKTSSGTCNQAKRIPHVHADGMKLNKF